VTNRLQRWTGIGGLIFVVLLAASVFLVSDTPATNASLVKVANYYNSHNHQRLLGVDGIETMIAVVVGVFWFWYFREWLVAVKPVTRRLATVGFAGGVLLGAGGGMVAGMYFSLSDAYHHATPAAFQTMNFLQQDLPSGVVVAGGTIILFATGLLIIRYRALPVWLGWVAVVFAVLGLPSGATLPALGLWLIAVNIVIILRAGNSDPGMDAVVGGAPDTGVDQRMNPSNPIAPA
jgi:hypothetical protein